MAILLIKPSELTPAVSVGATDDLVVDNGTTVASAKPAQIVNAGRPIASEQQAVAGSDNTTAMTPLRVAQAIVSVGEPIMPAAEAARDKAQDWAESATAPGDPGTKSAKTWAGEAADYALASGPFADRTAAQAATIPGDVDLIRVRAGDLLLEYLRDPMGTALTTADGAKWSPSGTVTPEHWGAKGDGVTDDAAAINAMFAYRKGGAHRIGPGDYRIDSSVTILRKYTSGIGRRWSVDCAGARFSGAGSIVIDSCKAVEISNLIAPETILRLRGSWLTNFHNCQFQKVVFADAAGEIFTENYWNSFYNCVIQQLEIPEGAVAASNAMFFYSCSMRGTPSLATGTTGTFTDAIIFAAPRITQGWKFYGGDISYYSNGVVSIPDATNPSSEVSIYFDGVYFDSEVPLPVSRDNTIIETKNCQAAGSPQGAFPLSALGAGKVDLISNLDVFRVGSSAPVNLIPNGDFRTDVSVPELSGGDASPFSSVSGATVTKLPGEGFGAFAVGISQSASNVVRLRGYAPFDGRYSAVLVMRSPGGERDFRAAVFGIRYPHMTIGTDWTAYAISLPKEVSAGSITLEIYPHDLGAWTADIAYAGIFYGAEPAIGASWRGPTEYFRRYAENLSSPISAGGVWSNAYTVAGAKKGDFVDLSLSVFPSGIIPIGRVESDNTLRVRLHNISGSPITVGNTSIRVRITASQDRY